jgi:iron complex outermembrane receptor protein
MSASALVLAACLPGAAVAQGASAQLEEIVVTAQKREQSLQEVPISVSAVTADTLEANRITTARDLSAVVPNLTVRTNVGGSALPFYTLRGLVALGSVAGADKGLGVYIDGVYLAAAQGSLMELAEIARIEVLRGPQGTLFGRNSTGGAISFITPEPRGEFGLKQTVTLGNYDQFRSVTRLHTPQMGAFSAMFTYTHSERRGDVRNLGAGTRWDFSPANGGRPDVRFSPKWLGSSNNEAVSGAIKFEPNEKFDTLFRFDYSESDYTASPLGNLYRNALVRNLFAAQPNQALLTPISRERPDAVNNGQTLPSRSTGWGGSLTSRYRISDTVSLKNILAYRRSTGDGDWVDISGAGVLINTGAPVFAQALGPALAASTVGAPFLIQATSTTSEDRQWSDELQLNVDTDFVTLTAGALYFEHQVTRGPFGEEVGLGRARSGAFRVYPGGLVPFAGQAAGTQGRATTVKIRSYAGYAQGEFHVTPQLDLIAGARYTKDIKKGLDFGIYSAAARLTFPLRYEKNKFTYNLGVNYEVRDDFLVYAKYSTGYISGGSIAAINYDPETAKSWEAGLKADWFDHTLRTNLAVFTVKYGGLQVTVNGATLSPPNPAITQALINAGSARAKGFELETVWTPARGLTFSGGAGFTDFKYLSLLPAVTVGAAEYLEAYRPEWTVNLAAQYDSEPVIGDAYVSARLDANWKSRQSALGGVPSSLSVSERAVYKAAAVIDPYWLVNGRLALQGFKIGGADATLALWAKNLLNDKSLNYAVSLVTVMAADYERARTVGVDLTVEF